MRQNESSRNNTHKQCRKQMEKKEKEKKTDTETEIERQRQENRDQNWGGSSSLQIPKDSKRHLMKTKEALKRSLKEVEFRRGCWRSCDVTRQPRKWRKKKTKFLGKYRVFHKKSTLKPSQVFCLKIVVKWFQVGNTAFGNTLVYDDVKRIKTVFIWNE